MTPPSFKFRPEKSLALTEIPAIAVTANTRTADLIFLPILIIFSPLHSALYLLRFVLLPTECKVRAAGRAFAD
jgi:hypothetical protein